MSILEQLKPTSNARVMDLVEQAGIDVSEWASSPKGAANQKYCREWAFHSPGRVVVLNLWYEELLEDGGVVFRRINFRPQHQKRKDQQRRARTYIGALADAWRNQLPVRSIIGERKGENQVGHRYLDPYFWAVTSYDERTGYVLTRGARSPGFVDQFLVADNEDSPAERRNVNGTAFFRDPELRQRALNRANGNCEHCGARGFEMADGRIFLETHHVIPLSEGGPDAADNIVALCPNHHREAHHGQNAMSMRETLREFLLRAAGQIAARATYAG